MKWEFYYHRGINSILECGRIDLSEGFSTCILTIRENQQKNQSEQPLGA
jgi:hypothetical protein